MQRKTRVVLVIVLSLTLTAWLVSSNVMAMTSEERIQKLDDKFIDGEISEETYKRLLKKYRGDTGAPETKKVAAEEVKPVAGNMIKNWSFEETSAGMPADWELSDKINRLQCELDTSTGHSGSSSIRLSCPTTTYWQEGMVQNLSLQPGKSYLVNFWYKGENVVATEGVTCVVSFEYLMPDGKYKAQYIEPRQIINQWKTAAKKITVPSGAQAGKGRIMLRLYRGSGTLWYDDVVVKEVP